MLKKLIYLSLLFIAGCESKPDLRNIEVRDSSEKIQRVEQRFYAESHGIFHGGYSKNVREIFIITDKQTGKQYLTVTGCGTTELVTVQEGKYSSTKEE